jgi:hypothetical protein
VRVGFTVAYNALDAAQQNAIPSRPSPNLLGIEATAAMAEWIWDSGLAAVASDGPSFEQALIAGRHTAIGGVWKGEAWETDMQGRGLLHQWLLGGGVCR